VYVSIKPPDDPAGTRSLLIPNKNSLFPSTLQAREYLRRQSHKSQSGALARFAEREVVQFSSNAASLPAKQRWQAGDI
jgi:hypothetical protein